MMDQLRVAVALCVLFTGCVCDGLVAGRRPGAYIHHGGPAQGALGAAIDRCDSSAPQVCRKLAWPLRLPCPRTSKGFCTRMFFSTPDVGNLLFAPQDQRFFNAVWFPYFARPTYVEEVPPSQGTQWATLLGGMLGSPAPGINMWMFEQPIGFLNITVNLRMTVIKLLDGDLLVYNPVAPTGECVRELHKLGRVRHIVLGTTALEHKVFCRAFVDKFPDASLYVPPGIFNLIPGRSDLSPPGLGLFVDLVRPCRIDGYLTPNFQPLTFNGVEYPASEVPSWAKELSHETLMFDAPPIASACEVAMLHKASRTLLVTDSVTYISSTKEDWIARSGSRDRDKMWPFNNYPQEWSRAKKKALDMMQVWTVQTPYKDEDFEALTDKLYVCPQLRLFVLESDGALTKEWVDRVSKWDIGQIIPAHFDAPIKCSRQDFRKAFSFVLDRKLSYSEAPLPGDHCIGVQKAVQVILRRTLFRSRLDKGLGVDLEYADFLPDSRDYKGTIELPLIGRVTI